MAPRISSPLRPTIPTVWRATFPLKSAILFRSRPLFRTPRGLTFAADSGVYTAPFTAANGTLAQSVTTGLASSGRAAYNFNIVKAGSYLVSAMVIAPNLGQNSFYVNIDAEPTDPLMIWDVPVSSILDQPDGLLERQWQHQRRSRCRSVYSQSVQPVGRHASAHRSRQGSWHHTRHDYHRHRTATAED